MIVEFSTLHGLASLSATCHQLHDILFPVLMHKASKFQLPGVTSILHWASKQGYIRVVKGLLGAGVTIDVLDQTGSSALMYASESGHLDISQYLLTQGAS
jgi:ankyrin repeat protein